MFTCGKLVQRFAIHEEHPPNRKVVQYNATKFESWSHCSGIEKLLIAKCAISQIQLPFTGNADKHRWDRRPMCKRALHLRGSFVPVHPYPKEKVTVFSNCGTKIVAVPHFSRRVGNWGDYLMTNCPTPGNTHLITASSYSICKSCQPG